MVEYIVELEGFKMRFYADDKEHAKEQFIDAVKDTIKVDQDTYTINLTGEGYTVEDYSGQVFTEYTGNEPSVMLIEMAKDDINWLKK